MRLVEIFKEVFLGGLGRLGVGIALVEQLPAEPIFKGSLTFPGGPSYTRPTLNVLWLFGRPSLPTWMLPPAGRQAGEDRPCHQ
jgi:hypothetical protein